MTIRGSSNRLLCSLVVLGGLCAPAQDRRLAPVNGSGRRYALIIGNNAYPWKPLKNAVNDAKDLAAELPRVGFAPADIMLVTDANLLAMQKASVGFLEKLRADDLAFVFYSGHGVEVRGENYLVPVDFPSDASELDVQYRAFSAQQFLHNLEGSPARARIMILDACRDNPLRATRSAAGGLARMDPSGTLIVFATGSGRTADDNATGRNGFFTAHLLKDLPTPGLSVSNLMQQVGREVNRDSAGKQTPALYGLLLDDYPLLGGTAPSPATTAAVPLPVSGIAGGEEAWRMVKDSTNPEDLEDFAKEFSSSAHARVATLRAAQLRRASAAAAVSPKPNAVLPTPIPSSTTFMMPNRIVECESPNCAPGSDPSPRVSPVWTFSGLAGEGHFGTGVQPLTIEHYDGSTIVVRRRDTTGSATGLTARYMGVIEGNQISGSITYWPGARTGPWTAKIDFSAQPLINSPPAGHSNMPTFPFRVVECEGGSCANPAAAKPVWTFANAQGRGQFASGNEPLTLVHLDGDLIVVRREDTTGSAIGLVAVYIGTIAGNRIEGSVTYWHGGGPTTGTWSGVWQAQ